MNTTPDLNRIARLIARNLPKNILNRLCVPLLDERGYMRDLGQVVFETTLALQNTRSDKDRRQLREAIIRTAEERGDDELLDAIRGF